MPNTGKIVWDAVGEHLYETGVDRGVFYEFDTTNKVYTNGVAWNGLTAVNEQPSGAEASPLYADNIKYLNLMSAEQYAATIEAYYCPDEFMACDGFVSLTDGVIIGQQPRKIFGFCYRTLIGSDTEGTAKGYKIHLVYNCQASPSEKSHATVNESPEAATLSWSISTTPVDVANQKPTATLEIDTTKLTDNQRKAIEDVLYGLDAGDNQVATTPRMPLPAEVASIITSAV